LERLFLGIPHLTVLAPSHVHDPGTLLRAAVGAGTPTLFVENKLLYPQALLLDAGEGVIRRRAYGAAGGHPCVELSNYAAGEPPDVAVAAYGGMSRLLVNVLVRMAAEEVRVLAVLPSAVSPLDAAPIAAAAGASGRLLIIEESPAAFGWGAEVAAQVAQQSAVRFARLGGQPTVIPAAKPLEDNVLVSEESIEAALLNLLR
jgi:pyruvate/2-oxoglutarate/acetoin dehydrogenase E1 component